MANLFEEVNQMVGKDPMRQIGQQPSLFQSPVLIAHNPDCDRIWNDLSTIPVELKPTKAAPSFEVKTASSKEALQEMKKDEIFKPTADQVKILDILVDHVDKGAQQQQLFLLIQGSPDTGKTWLINAIREILKTQQIGSLASAFTGIAANNMEDGETIHRMCHMPVSDRR